MIILFADLFFLIIIFPLNATTVPRLLNFWKLAVSFLLSKPVQLQNFENVCNLYQCILQFFHLIKSFTCYIFILSYSLNLSLTKSLHVLAIKMTAFEFHLTYIITIRRTFSQQTNMNLIQKKNKCPNHSSCSLIFASLSFSDLSTNFVF